MKKFSEARRNAFAAAIFFAALLLCQTSVMAKGADDSVVDDVALRCKALEAAYRHAKEERMAVEGKTVVISENRGFIVVSFIRKKGTYGGGMYVVYSPAKAKVVYSFIEE